MRYNVILFDADETLYDYAKSEAFALSGVFGEIDQECTDAIVDSYRRINQQLWSDFEQGRLHSVNCVQPDLSVCYRTRHNVHLDADAFSDVYIKYLGQGSF